MEKLSVLFIIHLDKVNVGESCVVNAQCKGTPVSTVCENSTCTCTKGYISLGQHCYEGKQFLIKLAARE